jgi:hypothetical protein
MKTELKAVTGMMAVALMAANPGISASVRNGATGPAQMVITVRPAPGGGRPDKLEPADLTVLQGNTRARVIGLQRLASDLSDMQLLIVMDDSTRSSSLGTQLPDLKTFLKSLPAATQVGIGYMRNGTVALTQAFTTDHEKATKALRLPVAIPGENGSPYFALSDLAGHWPSKESTGRRAVLMLTDGVDRYYGSAVMDDPYADEAVRAAQKQGVMVYSIYLRGAGVYGRGDWVTTVAQSRLIKVSEETGGYAYFQDLTDPVTISPFLSDFQDRIENQYRVTIEPLGDQGAQPVKLRLRTETPGVKIEGPTEVFVR